MPHHQIGKIICPVVQPGGKMRESGHCKSEFEKQNLGKINQISLTLQGGKQLFTLYIRYKIKLCCYVIFKQRSEQP
jgi:hypothetical protein